MSCNCPCTRCATNQCDELPTPHPALPAQKYCPPSYLLGSAFGRGVRNLDAETSCPKTANGMVRPCSGPASALSWPGGVLDKEHAHVPEAQRSDDRNRHRYRAICPPRHTAVPGRVTIMRCSIASTA